MEEGVESNISLVVVNHNAGYLLAKCVESSCPQVSEIVIVDNASTDFSLEKTEELLLDYPHGKVIRNKKNIGFSAACNIGYYNSTKDIVLFLNPDCQLDQNAVAEMFQALTANSDNGMVGGLLVNPDGTEQRGGRRATPSLWRSLVRAFGLYKLSSRWPKLFSDFNLHELSLPEDTVEVEAISGACMMVKRKAVDDVGVWDEGYFLHCEDLDWCMRFRSKGWRILFVPSARVTHAASSCSKSRPLFVEWHKHKGMIRFYRKFYKHKYPYVLMWLVLFGVWLRFSFVLFWKLLVLGKVKLLSAATSRE